MEALERALAEAASGTGRCVALIGEPGIGKSRLAREVVARAAQAGLAVAVGRAVPGSHAAAFRPLTEALLQLLHDQQVLGDPALAPWLGALYPLVPTLAPPRSAAADVLPAVRGEAILRLLRRACPFGAVLLLEDLHWADRDTVSLLEYLADNVRRERLLVVLTLRDSPPSEVLDMARRHRGPGELVYLALGRLSDDESAAMARACGADLSDPTLARVAAAAEGVPLLVEELLNAPGLPDSLAATVTARLGELDEEVRAVLSAAAVLGRDFEWELLAAMTGRTEAAVGQALSAGVGSLLLTRHGGRLRFRHALTRDAVLDTLLPPDRRRLAAAALECVGELTAPAAGVGRETAIDLAVRAGNNRQAGLWLIDAGREALSWGALASAADSTRYAAELLAGHPEQADAELALVEALALAGRVEEAAAAGGRLVTRLGRHEDAAGVRVQAHLHLARAAVAASRWQMARHQLDAARRLTPWDQRSDVGSQIAVLSADVLMADDDYDGARRVAEDVVTSDGVAPDVRCHGLEIIGRTRRSLDLAAARRAFGEALITAETSDLPFWRLRALHELGTVDLFDHAGVERLLQARQAAAELGALSTGAILDLQLSAAYTCRWDLDACDTHARSAIDIAERLALDLVKAKGYAMLAGSAGMRTDVEEMERCTALAAAAAPEDRMLDGFGWGMRGLALMLAGDDDDALGPYARGIAILGDLPHAEPAALRAVWPVLLAARGDAGAAAAIDEAKRLGVAAFGMNQALVGYAEALCAAGQGDTDRARRLVSEADPRFANCEGWADLARLLAAPSALRSGWADANGWLTRAAARFFERGLAALAARCEQLLGRTEPNPWSAAGVTGRESDVLRLIGEGLANKQIAVRLHLSPRTVEKHVESLLRKTGSRSRTDLVVRTFSAGATGGPPTATT